VLASTRLSAKPITSGHLSQATGLVCCGSSPSQSTPRPCGCVDCVWEVQLAVNVAVGSQECCIDSRMLPVALCRFEQLEAFVLDHHAADQHHSSLGRCRKRPLSFHRLLRAFASSSELSGAYFLADMKNMLLLAKLLRHVEPFLGLSDMYTCCISPASADDGPVVQVQGAQHMGQG